MTPRVRWATVADVPMLVEVLMLSSRSHVPRGVWDVMFPDDAVRSALLATLLRTPRLSWCHHRNFLVAEVDGEPAAALSGYVENGPGMIDEDTAILEAATAIGLGSGDVEAAFARLTPFLECLPPKIGSPWIVEWVATLPAFRRRGLVHLLLREMLDEGRRRGYENAQIMILIGNLAAEQAYQRVGFQHRDERRSAGFEALLGTPGIGRMWIDALAGDT